MWIRPKVSPLLWLLWLLVFRKNAPGLHPLLLLLLCASLFKTNILAFNSDISLTNHLKNENYFIREYSDHLNLWELKVSFLKMNTGGKLKLMYIIFIIFKTVKHTNPLSSLNIPTICFICQKIIHYKYN